MQRKKETPAQRVDRLHSSLRVISNEMLSQLPRQESILLRRRLDRMRKATFEILRDMASRPEISPVLNMAVMSIEEVQEVKAMLWNGIPQWVIAETFKVSQPTISRICNGVSGETVAWPDGNIGAMSPVRRRAILTERAAHTEPQSPPDDVILAVRKNMEAGRSLDDDEEWSKVRGE